jgi:hypothetical protein
MAYPWHPITFGGFLEWTERDFGVIENSLPDPIIGPGGPITVTWLERADDDGQVYRVPMPEIDDRKDYLNPIMVSYLCRRLGLDPAVFGYDVPLFDGTYVDAPDDGSTWDLHPLR